MLFSSSRIGKPFPGRGNPNDQEVCKTKHSQKCGELLLVSYCSNPDCMKPLHYLREGRIYVFDLPDLRSKRGLSRHLEHFWLCGSCSRSFLLEQAGDKAVRIVPKRPQFPNVISMAS